LLYVLLPHIPCPIFNLDPQEFDTPLNLFNRDESLFRSLCEKSNITLTDIEKAGILYDDDDEME